MSVKGTLTAYIATGTEGHLWCLQVAGKKGEDGLRFLNDGDFLRVFNDKARKKVLWEGKVRLDFNRCVKPNPHVPAMSGQWVETIGTVRGLQKGMSAKKWVKMFLDAKPAEIIIAPTPKGKSK